MNGINRYQNSYQALQSKATGKKQGIKKAEETGQAQESVKLSSKAKKYFNELKKKYGNMDFTVANYSSDEEAQKYLSKGNKQYSVLIDPETLEKMANDEGTRNRYEGIIANAGGQLNKVKEGLGEDAKNIQSLGISIDKDGIVSYLAEMVIERNTTDNSANLTEDKTEKADKKTDKKEQKDTKNQIQRFKASSIEELIKQIREAQAQEKTNSVETEREKAVGQSFDYKI